MPRPIIPSPPVPHISILPPPIPRSRPLPVLPRSLPPPLLPQPLPSLRTPTPSLHRPLLPSPQRLHIRIPLQSRQPQRLPHLILLPLLHLPQLLRALLCLVLAVVIALGVPRQIPPALPPADRRFEAVAQVILPVGGGGHVGPAEVGAAAAGAFFADGLEEVHCHRIGGGGACVLIQRWWVVGCCWKKVWADAVRGGDGSIPRGSDCHHFRHATLEASIQGESTLR